MDENKNWVNWKSYDAYAQLKLIVNSSNSPMNYTFEYSGLYVLLCGCYGTTSLPQLTTTATRKDIKVNYSYGDSRNSSFVALVAENDQTMTASFSNAYGGSVVLIYIGPYTQIDLLDFKTKANTISVENTTNHIILANEWGSNARSISSSCTTSQYVTDGYNYACCSTCNETGSASITTITDTSGGGGAMLYHCLIS